MPEHGGRTTDYAIWKVCERFRILPPGIKKDWDANPPWIQALLLAYTQIREIEENERDLLLAKVLSAKA